MAQLEFDENAFVAASDALQEITNNSALAGGFGTKTLTEPLLLWCDRYGSAIVADTLKSAYR